MTSKYWIGKRPSQGARLGDADKATVRDDLREDVVRLYSRYVEQWNRIELDPTRSLAEHTNELSGATMSCEGQTFTLHAYDASKGCWILEVHLAEGCSIYRSGLSFALNAQKSEDMRSIRLHWSGSGNLVFEEWLEHQRSQEEA